MDMSRNLKIRINNDLMQLLERASKEFKMPIAEICRRAIRGQNSGRYNVVDFPKNEKYYKPGNVVLTVEKCPDFSGNFRFIVAGRVMWELDRLERQRLAEGMQGGKWN